MSKNQEYNARVFSDKVLKEAVRNEIEKMALVLLGNKELKFQYFRGGIDSRQGKDKTIYYIASWDQWFVEGKNKTEIYLEVIRLLSEESSIYFPIVSYRKDSRWISKEELETEDNK